MVVLLHSDIDNPFAKPDTLPVYARQMGELLVKHKDASIIWVHTGLGRVVYPTPINIPVGAPNRPPTHLDILTILLEKPQLGHVNFDISWSEVAKYIVSSDASVKATAALINKYPDRFLFGKDEVAPADQEAYLRVYRQYAPLWAALTPEARLNVTRTNYERIFDEANRKVRAWEQANFK